jgi:rhodanese-related sulfurtransferase
MIQLTLGILAVAAAATVGDYIWYTFGVRHSMTAGLIHGALLLTAVGAVLGASAGHLLRGLPIGALAGLGGAASYYALIAVTGGQTYGAAIPASWIILWLLLASLDGRWLRAPARRSWRSVAARGALAAVLGGGAFFLVMEILWGRPPAGGRNYVLQWLAWAFAWAPGLLALTGGQKEAGSVDPTDTMEAGSSHAARTPAAQVRPPQAHVDTSISNIDLLARIDSGDAPPILDVRSEQEFTAGHVPGAVNVPFNQVPCRMSEVPGAPGEELIVYCGHGPRAYMAAVPLKHSGERRVVFMSGHWAGWEATALRVER